MWTRKRIIYIVLAVIVVAFIVWQLTHQKGVTAATDLIEASTLTVAIRGEGQTRLVDSFVISSPVSGQLERVSLKVGDAVQQGDVLFRVMPPRESEQSSIVSGATLLAAKARQAQAEVMVSDAREVAERAKVTLARQQALAKDDIVTPDQLEAAVLAASSAEKRVETASEALRAAKADVRAAEAMALSDSEKRAGLSTTVRAPSMGHVLRLFQRDEQALVQGTPVMEIGNTRLMELVVDVLSEDAVQIKPGNPVEITGWGGSVITGRVRTIEPSAFTKISALGVEEQRVNVIIDFDSIPQDLGVGYRVEVEVIVLEQEDVVVVPVSAVFKEVGQWFAYVVVDDKVEKRGLGLGSRSSEVVEVVTGLSIGDEVVVYPSAEVESGVKIER